LKGQAVVVQLSDFGLGRGLNLAKSMTLLGLDVTIITNKPIYGLRSRVPVSDSFRGRVVEFEIPFARALYRSLFGRLIVYLVFMISSFRNLMSARRRPVLLLSEGPEPFAEIACVAYAKLIRRTSTVSDITDVWPDALRFLRPSDWRTETMIAVGIAVMRLTLARLDAIITLNDLMKLVLQERYDRPASVIYGAIDTETFKPLLRQEVSAHLPLNVRPAMEKPFVVLHAGLLGPVQDPQKIIDLAVCLKDNRDISFVLIGEGPLKKALLEKARFYKLDNFAIVDTVPSYLMPIIYGASDLFLLTSAENPLAHLLLPRKFIEYTASGKPVVCLTPPCVASSLCETWDAGAHFAPNDIEGASRFIERLKEDRSARLVMGENARRMAVELFSLEKASDELRNVIRSCSSRATVESGKN
jgi:glycosyltransferase involved in cell wall biosynthesis